MTYKTTQFRKCFLFSFLFSFLAYSGINAQTLTSATPNKGQLGQQLSVFIGGQNVNFFNGSSSIQTSFNQGGTSISAPPLSVNQAGNELEVYLDLGNTSYPSGLYDITMNTPAHGVLTLNNAFEIDSVALKGATPRVGFKGQNFNVLLIGQSIDFSAVTTAPTYFGGPNTINTTIVGTRGIDTLEIAVSLSAANILAGNYDLSLLTPQGTLILRNALEVKTTNIFGTVFYDPNANSTQDMGEPGIRSISLKIIPSGRTTTTNTAGMYSFSDITAGTYDVIVTPPMGAFSTAASDTQRVVVNSLNDFEASFGLNTTNTTNTQINTVTGRARCNASVTYLLYVYNSGIPSSTGVFYFVKDASLTFNPATVSSADSISGDTAFYSFNNLAPFTNVRQQVTCNIPPITVVPIGSTLVGISGVYLLDPLNNVIAGSEKNHISTTIVRCSFDPNDKLVNPVGKGVEGYIEPDTPLEYTIRFQNTGNDTAFRVVIIDTLSSQFDYSTFEFLDASHNVITNLETSGELTFTFNNIFLVDSTTNEPESNGYVAFRIQPNSNLPDSTSIANRAGIYFDFNPPIITNFAVNTFALFVTGVKEIENGLSATLFPNPTNGQLNVKLEQVVKNAVLTIYDIRGNKVYTKDQINNNELQLNLSSYANGVYFIRIVEGSNSYLTKVILRK